MPKGLRLVSLLVLTTALSIASRPAAASEPAEASEWKIVVRATYKSFSAATKTITYTSPKGTYSATLIGVRRYRLRGTISGRRLTGRIRTRQTSSGTRYKATGSGKLGARSVKISGGGPNNLRTATLILT